MKVTSIQIDHLGVVAGVFDSLGIADVIDSRLSKLRHHKITHSAATKSMVINGLGSVGQRPYLYPEYFENHPVELLIGAGIHASDINDETIGSTLDAIYEYGPTKLFNEIVMETMGRHNLGAATQILRADTTSFSVSGEYDIDEDDGQKFIELVLGHSKTGRMDSKQSILSMVTNQHGLPLLVQPLSGRTADKKTSIEAIEKVKTGLSLGDDDTYFIADSTIYTADNLQRMGQSTTWITRVPATIGEAKELLDADIEMQACQDSRYSCFVTASDYGDIDQRWGLFQAEPMKKRMENTFEMRLQKLGRSAQKDLGKLMSREYACEADAMKDAEIWVAAQPFHRLEDLVVATESKRAEGKRGRPKKDELLATVYSIKARLEVDETAVAKARDKLGRFILASNDTLIDPETAFQYYKGQQAAGRGFRFMKDKRFWVAEVYLKKEGRIEALAMIMVLTRLVYSFAEWALRKGLKETGQSVFDQKGKPTQRPTLKWMFFLFYRVMDVTVEIDGMTHREITNLKEPLKIMLRLLGPECEKYYGMRS